MATKNIPAYPYCLCGGCSETIHVTVESCPKCGYVKPPVMDVRGFARMIILIFALALAIIIYLHG